MASNHLQESSPSQGYCFQDVIQEIPWSLKERIVQQVDKSGQDIWIRELLFGHLEGLKMLALKVQRPDLEEIIDQYQTKMCPVSRVEDLPEQRDHLESVIPPSYTCSLQTSLLDGYGSGDEQNIGETAGIDGVGGIELGFIQRHSVDGSVKHFHDNGRNSQVWSSQQHLPQTKLPVESETSDRRDELDPSLPRQVNPLCLAQLQRVELEVKKLSKQSARNFEVLVHGCYDLRKELDHHFPKLQGAFRGPVRSRLKMKGAMSSSCSRQDKKLTNKSPKVMYRNVSTQTDLPVESGTNDTANRLDPSLPGQVSQLWLPQLQGVEREVQKLSKQYARELKILMRELYDLRKELDHQFFKLQGAVSCLSSSRSRARADNKLMKKAKKWKWTESSSSSDGGDSSSEASLSL